MGRVVSNHSSNWSRRGTGDQSGCNEQDISQAYFRPYFEIGAAMDVFGALCHDLYQLFQCSCLFADGEWQGKGALREIPFTRLDSHYISPLFEIAPFDTRIN
jgi:hypothetical protein